MAPILIFIGYYATGALILQADALRGIPFVGGVIALFDLYADRLFRGEPALIPRFGIAPGFKASALIASILFQLSIY